MAKKTIKPSKSIHQLRGKSLLRYSEVCGCEVQLLRQFHHVDTKFNDGRLVPLAKEIKAIVDDKSQYTDLAQRTDIKAELKVAVIVAMAKAKYPPFTNDEVFKEILEQAENFKKNLPVMPRKLEYVEDDLDMRNLIYSRIVFNPATTDYELQHEVMEQYGERYPDMKIMDWARIVADYTPMVREAFQPKSKVIPMDYDMVAEGNTIDIKIRS